MIMIAVFFAEQQWKKNLLKNIISIFHIKILQQASLFPTLSFCDPFIFEIQLYRIESVILGRFGVFTATPRSNRGHSWSSSLPPSLAPLKGTTVSTSVYYGGAPYDLTIRRCGSNDPIIPFTIRNVTDALRDAMLMPSLAEDTLWKSFSVIPEIRRVHMWLDKIDNIIERDHPWSRPQMVRVVRQSLRRLPEWFWQMVNKRVLSCHLWTEFCEQRSRFCKRKGLH